MAVGRQLNMSFPSRSEASTSGGIHAHASQGKPMDKANCNMNAGQDNAHINLTFVGVLLSKYGDEFASTVCTEISVVWMNGCVGSRSRAFESTNTKI